MSKVYIDTNVILDLLAKREPFYIESKQIFSLGDLGQINLIVSALSLVNTFYILNDALKIKNTRSLIGKFKVLFETFDLNDKIIDLALSDKHFKDFEDGIQYYTAVESRCELIITRNKKDFKKSMIPVFSPREYLTKIKTDK